MKPISKQQPKPAGVELAAVPGDYAAEIEAATTKRDTIAADLAKRRGQLAEHQPATRELELRMSIATMYDTRRKSATSIGAA